MPRSSAGIDHFVLREQVANRAKASLVDRDRHDRVFRRPPLGKRHGPRDRGGCLVAPLDENLRELCSLLRLPQLRDRLGEYPVGKGVYDGRRTRKTPEELLLAALRADVPALAAMPSRSEIAHNEVLEADEPDPRPQGRFRGDRNLRLAEVLEELQIRLPLQAQEVVEVDCGPQEKIAAQKGIPDLEPGCRARASSPEVNHAVPDGVVLACLQTHLLLADDAHAAYSKPWARHRHGNEVLERFREVDQGAVPDAEYGPIAVEPCGGALDLHPAAVARNGKESDPLVSDAQAAAWTAALVEPRSASPESREIPMELDRREADAVVADFDRRKVAGDGDADRRRIRVVSVRNELLEGLDERLIDARELPDDRRIDPGEPHRLPSDGHAPRREEPPRELPMNFAGAASSPERTERTHVGPVEVAKGPEMTLECRRR